jgi:TPR repeat protein
MKWFCFLLLVMRLSGADLGSLPEVELRGLVAKKDLPAMVELADRQLFGKIMPFDQAFVLKTFQQGSEAGIARAHSGLALCHMWGVGMKKDLAPTLKLLEKAAKQGDPLGTYRLGLYHYYGTLMPQNPQQGMALIQKAIDLGCEDAEAALARLILTGEGVPKNQKDGLARLQRLADEKGNPQAAMIVGDFYRGMNGNEGPKNPGLAKKYLLMAAEKNHAGAMVALGDIAMYNGGWDGKKPARLEGAGWYRKAIARNSGDGMLKLAKMQQRDQAVRLPGEDWYQLLLDADRVGNGSATQYLAEVNYHAAGYTYRDLDWSKTAYFHHKYIKDGYGGGDLHSSLHRLYEIYFEGGLGLDRDYKKCIEIAQPYFDYCDKANEYAGRILLHPDAPLGKTREHFIRGYACMLKAKAMHDHVSDGALFVLRSRHGMTRKEVARAEELVRSGFPNPHTPLLP